MMGSVRRAVAALVAGCGLVLASATPATADEPAVSGTVIDHATGAAVAGACVVLVHVDDDAETASACVDDAGNFAVETLPPGSYRLRVSAPGFPDQWAVNSPDAHNAFLIPYSPSFPVQLGQIPLWREAGTIRGALTDAHGAPASATVRIVRSDQSWQAETFTDSAGRYQLTPVPPGSYLIQFTNGRQGQYAHGQLDIAAADLQEVVDGQVTVVDEQFLPLPTLIVQVIDAANHRPVPGACVGLFDVTGQTPDRCAGQDGVVRFADVASGSTSVTAYDPALLHYGQSLDQEIGLGTTRLRLALQPGAVIRTQVRDAATGRPASACVDAVDSHGHGYRGPSRAFCSDPTTGTLAIGPITPGDLQLFADPFDDDSHGAQWVGWHGGTGDQRRARIVPLRLRESVTVPPIRMDPAGSITGTVRERSTGQPAPQICTFPYAVDPVLGIDNRCTGTAGTYTITGLGPYDWPVEFASRSFGEAWQWSGDVADRFSATMTRVYPGQASVVDANLVPGGTLHVVGVDSAGVPLSAQALVYNARTGDFATFLAGSGGTQDRSFTIRALATQPVKIEYTVFATGQTCFFDRKLSFRTAATVSVTADTANPALTLVADCGA